ncbi:hypothetical protein DC429_01195 [Arthrobacter sp. TPD3018]|nr:MULTISPECIES: hypothetical protein [Bacteria]PVE59060.1 hypothetical protein DC425_01195 [Sphingomonas sp. TPD3009]PVE60583.1 hypothetical protein DC429_01195 [Arthrobacter sp. TPD3018]PVE87259.1 hypothetical protein DC431_01190 [Sphingomonas melonis]
MQAGQLRLMPPISADRRPMCRSAIADADPSGGGRPDPADSFRPGIRAALGRAGECDPSGDLSYAGHDFNTVYGGIPNQVMRQIIMRFLAEYDPGQVR